MADSTQPGDSEPTVPTPLWAKDNLRKSDKVAGQQCFWFAYADRIADAASAKPKRRRRNGG